MTSHPVFIATIQPTFRNKLRTLPDVWSNDYGKLWGISSIRDLPKVSNYVAS